MAILVPWNGRGDRLCCLERGRLDSGLRHRLSELPGSPCGTLGRKIRVCASHLRQPRAGIPPLEMRSRSLRPGLPPLEEASEGTARGSRNSGDVRTGGLDCTGREVLARAAFVARMRELGGLLHF